MRLVVDTSALIAILRAEDEAPMLVDALGATDEALISAATLLEASIVAAGSRDESLRLRQLIKDAKLHVVPFSIVEAEAGAEAFRRFGKGSGHRAMLNFGDCFAYALARTRGLPLLFKGDDFIHTDIEPALRPG